MGWIKKYLINLGLVIISVVIAIVIVEVVLRFTPYDRTKRGDSVQRYYYMPDSLSGYDIANSFPKISVKFKEQITLDMEIWSNELGCFDKPYNREKETILLVGDSFTWGGFAPFEKTWGSIMEGLLNIRVLKCGVSGYGIKGEGNKIKKVVTKANVYPNLIILGYFVENDLIDDYLFPRYTVLGGYRLEQKKLLESGKITVVPENELRKALNAYLSNLSIYNIKIWLHRNSNIYNLLKVIPVARKVTAKFRLAEGGPLYSVLPERLPWLKNAWQKHLDNLEEIKSIADSYGSKLLVVIIPTQEQVYSFLRPSFEDIDWEYTNKRLAEFFNDKKFEYLDLLPLFREYADQTNRKFIDANKDLYWRYDGHWNMNGQYLAGLLVAKHIIEKGIIDVKDKEKRLAEINGKLNTLK